MMLLFDVHLHSHQLFQGFYNQFTNHFRYRVAARYIRILPQAFRGYLLCMRAEVIGCSFSQGKAILTEINENLFQSD